MSSERTASAECLRLVEAARGAWISRLIDTSRRNNLLFFQVGSGTISVDAEPVLVDLLAGKPVAADVLLKDKEVRVSRVLALSRKAQENNEEKGLQTLYLAVGFLRWPADDGGRDYACPALLFPVGMKHKGRDLSAIEVQVVGDPKINPVLLHILATEFEWAKRLLAYTRESYDRAMGWFKRQGPWVRAIGFVLTAAVVVGTLWILGALSFAAGLLGIDQPWMKSPIGLGSG